MTPFKVQILSADHPFFRGECESLTVPTLDGQFGILAGHSNMIAAVVPGMLHLHEPGKPEQIAAVSHGLVKIENGEVLILIDSAERPEEIDANRARREADAAKEAIQQKRSIQEYRSAQAMLARAVNRLQVKQHYQSTWNNK